MDRSFLHFAREFLLDPYNFDQISQCHLGELPFQPAVRSVEAGAKGVAKYFQNIRPLSTKSQKCLKLAVRWMDRHFGPWMRDSLVLDLNSALNVATLDKSPGALWRQYWEFKSGMVNDPRGLEVIQNYWEGLASTRAPEVLFGAHLKDELRSKEKVFNLSTRVFIAAPTEHTLAGVRLFHDQNKKMIQSAGSTFSAIGMNKYKLGWHRLATRLQRLLLNESLDVKNFDGSVYAIILWEVCQFRFNCLAKVHQTVENYLRVYNWYFAVINSLIILPDGRVIRKESGMPSGVLNTSTDDTLINFIYIIFNYLYNDGPPDYQLFMRHFVAALYGDDNVNNYSEEIAQYVNGHIYQRTMMDVFGIQITNVGLRSWKDLSFLSHSFVEMFGFYVPVLSQDRILCSQLIGSAEPAKSAERASAFRVLAWPYPPLFNLFTRYMMVLFEAHPHIPRTLMHSDDDIKDLYLSYEGSRGNSSTSNKMNIDLLQFINDENSISKASGESSTTTTGGAATSSVPANSSATLQIPCEEGLGGCGQV